MFVLAMTTLAGVPHPGPVGAQATAPHGSGAWAEQTGPGCEVDATYRSFLGRSPSREEMGPWLAHLRAGGRRSAVADVAARSEEWLAAEVTKVYERALERPPEAEAVTYWSDLLRRGATVQRLGSLVYGSREAYRLHGGTTEGFVLELYRRILDREPLSGDVGYWSGRVEVAGRPTVAGRFLASRESRGSRVAALYHTLLGRPPTDGDVDHWSQRLLEVNDVRLAVQLAASAEFGRTAQEGCTLPPLALTAVPSAAPPPMAAGRVTGFDLFAFGGVAPYTWSFDGLPDGLGAIGGAVLGHPARGGSHRIVASVVDAAGARSSHAFTLRVRPAASSGYGAWVDAYDWTLSMSGGRPAVTTATVDVMAREGVDVVYLQTARRSAPERLIEPARSRALIDRAHQHGMRVVAWYLPTLTEPAEDLARIRASLTLPVDALGIDIEGEWVADVVERNRRIVALSREVRAMTALPLLAIPPTPVALEDLQPTYWPRFPWRDLAPHYDEWMPMAYWSLRPEGDPWRDGYRYTGENIPRVRRNLGLPAAVVHVIGSPTTVADIQGMRRAIAEHGGTGGSVYDWATTPASLHPALRPLTSA